MMRGEGEGESFGFEASTKQKGTEVFGLKGVSKHSYLDKKPH